MEDNVVTMSGSPSPPTVTFTTATAAETLKPGHWSSEFQGSLGVPMLDAVMTQVLGSDYLPPNLRLAAYCLMGLYTLCRTWLKGKA